jgi:hypothetical protein
VNKPDYYRQHALECVRLSTDMQEPGPKAMLINMAQTWIRLSEQAQRSRSDEPGSETLSARPLSAAS